MSDSNQEYASIDFKPNMPQRDLLMNMKQFNIFECHRRAGKTYVGMIVMVSAALNTKYKNARFAFVAPEEKQGGRNVIDTLIDLAYHVPGTKFYKSEKKLVFPNGSSIFILGTKNHDSLRGGFWDGIILDEFRDMDDAEYTWNSVILPSITKWEDVERQGWIIITTTPPQKKHYYKDLFDMATKNDKWYVGRFNVMESGLFTPDFIEHLKRTMTPTSFAIEYMNSHSIPAEGAYFAEALNMAEEQKRIGAYPYNSQLGVYASFDVGKDGTAIWFAQKTGDKYYLIDYYQSLETDKQITHFINVLKSKPYRYNRIFLPHDTVKRSMVSDSTVYSLIKQQYGGLVRLLAREFIDDSIYRVNGNMFKCHFNLDSVTQGLQALREYSPKIDRNGNITNTIDHNWASHGSDSFRYMIQGLSTMKGQDPDSYERYTKSSFINRDVMDFDPF